MSGIGVFRDAETGQEIEGRLVFDPRPVEELSGSRTAVVVQSPETSACRGPRCLFRPWHPRPEEFETAEDGQQALILLRRASGHLAEAKRLRRAAEALVKPGADR